jgi:hypothetical protein
LQTLLAVRKLLTPPTASQPVLAAHAIDLTAVPAGRLIFVLQAPY